MAPWAARLGNALHAAGNALALFGEAMQVGGGRLNPPYSVYQVVILGGSYNTDLFVLGCCTAPLGCSYDLPPTLRTSSFHTWRQCSYAASVGTPSFGRSPFAYRLPDSAGRIAVAERRRRRWRRRRCAHTNSSYVHLR